MNGTEKELTYTEIFNNFINAGNTPKKPSPIKAEDLKAEIIRRLIRQGAKPSI